MKGPILRGLWLPAFTELLDGDCPIRVATELAPVSGFDLPVVGPIIRHSITYRRIEVVPVLLPISPTPVVAATWQWVTAGQSDFATSSLMEKLQKAFNTNK
ncbi:MAG: hypothetical protein K8R59_07650 [Thermoanaerobaculales bacterium]|nr:hypothetical protein [Thermoanaerobaculales bacterium]